MSKYCPYFWMHQTINTTGSVQPCCNVRPSTEALKNEWKNLNFLNGIDTDLHRQARKEMMQGIFPEICEVCKTREKNNIPSHRLRAIERFGSDHEVGIKFLDIKFSNTCNLGCRMCKPSDSSILSEMYSVISDRPNFLDSFIPNKEDFREKEKVEYTKKLIQNGLEILKVTGGEPLACKYFLEIIDWCVEKDYAKNLEINFTTNNTKINQLFINKLLKFKKVKIVLSIDGTGNIYNYIRYKSDWNKVKENTIQLSKYKDTFEIQIACILQFYNILDIKNLLDFATSLDLPLHFNENIKPKGSELHCLNINDEIKFEFNDIVENIIDQYQNYNNNSVIRYYIDDTITKLKFLKKSKIIVKHEKLIDTVLLQDKLCNTKFQDYLYPQQVRFLEKLKMEKL
jgi:MoaA/NifB/PqqE/SkfB family radical SAM enzyme